MDHNIYIIKKRGLFSSTYDITQNDEYIAVVEKESYFSMSMVMRDKEDNILLKIIKGSFFSSSYSIEIDNNTISRVTQKTFSRNFLISTPDGEFVMNTNFWRSEFTIVDDRENEFCKISKKGMGNSEYGLAINSKYDGLLYVAILVAILKILQSKKSS